jgi:hypothetical protein
MSIANLINGDSNKTWCDVKADEILCKNIDCINIDADNMIILNNEVEDLYVHNINVKLPNTEINLNNNLDINNNDLNNVNTAYINSIEKVPLALSIYSNSDFDMNNNNIKNCLDVQTDSINANNDTKITVNNDELIKANLLIDNLNVSPVFNSALDFQINSTTCQQMFTGSTACQQWFRRASDMTDSNIICASNGLVYTSGTNISSSGAYKFRGGLSDGLTPPSFSSISDYYWITSTETLNYVDFNMQNNDIKNVNDIYVKGMLKNTGAPNIEVGDDLDLLHNDILNCDNLTNSTANITIDPLNFLIMGSQKNIALSDAYLEISNPSGLALPIMTGFNGALVKFGADLFYVNSAGNYNLNNPYYNKGTVTQITSLTTPVTADYTGATITTVATGLASGAYAIFTVNNTFVQATSIINATLVNYSAGYGGGGIPSIQINNIVSGAFDIVVLNLGAVALAGILKINFVLH